MKSSARLLCVALLAGCGSAARNNNPITDGGGSGNPDFVPNPQMCVGLQCQIAQCDNGGDTTLSGRLFAPNGADPVPNAFVYVPNLGLPEFPTTVSCDLCGDIGAAATSTQTAYDGTFTLKTVPSGDSIPIVFQLGRFRRVINMPIAPCAAQSPAKDPNVDGVRLPHHDAELDAHDSIPRIAIATGDWDQIECVLKRMGLDRFDLYDDRGGAPPPTVGTLQQLLTDSQKLQGYNILVVNCTQNQFESIVAQANVKQNLHDYVAKGGRLYATDWAYDVVNQIPEFASFFCFQPDSGAAAMCSMNPQTPGVADSFDAYNNNATIVDPQLAEWLTLFPGVIDNQKQVSVQYSFVVLSGVASDMMSFPTKVWVQGPAKSYGTKPMTVTFDYMQCGRVHFSTYNTEPNGFVPDQTRFPNCVTDFSPQERILEYLMFEIASCIPNPG